MKTGLILGLAAASFICLGLSAPQPAAAIQSPAGLSIGADSVAQLVTPVKRYNRGGYRGKNWNRKNWNRRGVRRAYVRGWNRRPYYGRVVAGVALGTIIAASVAPRPPSDEVCWYWTNASKTRGYWDYCY